MHTLKVGILSGKDRDGNRQTGCPLGSLKTESVVPQGRSQGWMYCRSCDEVLSILTMTRNKYEYRSDPSLDQPLPNKSVNHSMSKNVKAANSNEVKVKKNDESNNEYGARQAKDTGKEYVGYGFLQEMGCRMHLLGYGVKVPPIFV